MPRRKVYRRKNYRRKRSIRKPFIRRVVRAMAEHKQTTGPMNGSWGSVGAAWQEVDLVSGISEGTAIYNRVGRKISVTALEIKGVLMGGAQGIITGDDLYNNMRILIYIGRAQKSGSSITPLATAGVSINTPLRRYTYNFCSQVLRNRYIGITNQPIDADTAAPGHKNYNVYIRFKKPLVIQYTGSGNHTNQTQLWVSMISDSSAVPNPGFTSGYYSLTWIDI